MAAYEGRRQSGCRKHRHEGVFVARGKEDALVTKNMVPGDSVYGEKRISVDEADGGKPIQSVEPAFAEKSPRVFSVVWTTFTSNQAQSCCI